MKIYDARFETPRNLFRLIEATRNTRSVLIVEIEGIVRRRPQKGDRLVAMDGTVFSFAHITPAGGPPGSFRAVLQQGSF